MLRTCGRLVVLLMVLALLMGVNLAVAQAAIGPEVQKGAPPMEGGKIQPAEGTKEEENHF